MAGRELAAVRLEDAGSTAPASQASGRRFDRLSALLEHFRVEAKVAADGFGEANLFILGERQAGAPLVPRVLLYRPREVGLPGETGEVLAAARVDLGTATASLAPALPPEIRIPLADAPALVALAEVMAGEVRAPRCGGQTIVDRLCEVLVVHMLRHAIETGASQPGLLAGLGDVRIAAALVAMHEAPGRAWRLQDLAERAGMSRTAFAARFHALVGETPVAHLQAWRLGLARAEIARGVALKTVALRAGFGSAAAFSRAFSRHFGQAPGSVRALQTERLPARGRSLELERP